MEKLTELIKKIDEIPLSDFERESLIPAIIERMKFYLDCFEKLLPVCDNPDNALLIDAAVKQVVANPAIDPNVAAPKAGQIYLESAKKNIKTYWISDLRNFLEEFPNPSGVTTGRDLFRLTQKAQQLAGQVVWCKTRLLSYSLRCFPVIVDKKSGETVCGLPNEIEIIVYPFLGLLTEMESSASSLMETIKEWGRSKKEVRKDYISYLASLEQTRSAKVLNWFQVLVILFTIVLTLASGKLMVLAKSLMDFIVTMVL